MAICAEKHYLAPVLIWFLRDAPQLVRLRTLGRPDKGRDLSDKLSLIIVWGSNPFSLFSLLPDRSELRNRDGH